jgi:hypothetical protein
LPWSKKRYFDIRTWRGAVRLAAMGAAILLANPARADDEPAKPAPRTSVIIGDASVVLVATNDQLYAFVDRVSDNAPLPDAELTVETADGVAIPMTRSRMATLGPIEGLLVGPLKRPGRMQDAFMVTLKSAAGSGDAPAEITYSDVVSERTATPNPATGTGTKIAVAIVSGAIGAAATMLVMSSWIGRKRKSPAAPGA